jgi:hypothetical protein
VSIRDETIRFFLRKKGKGEGLREESAPISA